MHGVDWVRRTVTVSGFQGCQFQGNGFRVANLVFSYDFDPLILHLALKKNFKSVFT